LTKKAAVADDEDDFIVPDGDEDEFDNEPDAVDFSAIPDEDLQAPKKKPAPKPAAKPAQKKAVTASKTDRSRKDLEAAKKAANADMFDFLRDTRDADQNPVGHPDYDPRTLYVRLNRLLNAIAEVFADSKDGLDQDDALREAVLGNQEEPL
jgi:hypothetical protein